MYTILIKEDKTVITTNREIIMQRDKLVNKLQVLCPRMFNGLDITKFDLAMLYRLPISHDLKLIILNLDNAAYKDDYCSYILDIDTDITSECGDVELNFQFMASELSDTGENIQQTQGIKTYYLHICQLSDYLALSDPAMNTLAQLYINNKNMILAQDKLMQEIYEKKLDDIKLDIVEGRIYGTSNGNKSGHGISVEELANEIVEQAGNSTGNIKLIEE